MYSHHCSCFEQFVHVFFIEILSSDNHDGNSKEGITLSISKVSFVPLRINQVLESVEFLISLIVFE